MDRRTRNLFVVALVIVIALTAGAAFVLGGGSVIPSPTPPADAATIDGVVIAVDAKSLTDVRSFALRTDDGRVLTFGLTQLENGAQFAPGHLAEHQATATPIRVWYRDGPTMLEAVFLQDAPAG